MPLFPSSAVPLSSFLLPFSFVFLPLVFSHHPSSLFSPSLFSFPFFLSHRSALPFLPSHNQLTHGVSLLFLSIKNLWPHSTESASDGVSLIWRLPDVPEHGTSSQWPSHRCSLSLSHDACLVSETHEMQGKVYSLLFLALLLTSISTPRLVLPSCIIALTTTTKKNRNRDDLAAAPNKE